MLGRITGLGGEGFVSGVSRSEAVLLQAHGKVPVQAVGLPGSRLSWLLSGRGFVTSKGEGQRPPRKQQMCRWSPEWSQATAWHGGCSVALPCQMPVRTGWLLNQAACGALIGTSGSNGGGWAGSPVSLSYGWECLVSVDGLCPLPPHAQRQPLEAGAAESHIGFLPVSTSGWCQAQRVKAACAEENFLGFSRSSPGLETLGGAKQAHLGPPPGNKRAPLACVELFRIRVRPEGAC